MSYLEDLLRQALLAHPSQFQVGTQDQFNNAPHVQAALQNNPGWLRGDLGVAQGALADQLSTPNGQRINTQTGQLEDENFFKDYILPSALALSAPFTTMAIMNAVSPAAGAAASASGAGPLAGGETGMAATDAAMAGTTTPASIAAITTPLLSGKTGDIIKAITGLSSAFAGKAIANNAMNGAVPPQLAQLLDLSVKRQQQLAPLGTAATAGMYQMLPDFAKTPQSMQGAQSLLGVK